MSEMLSESQCPVEAHLQSSVFKLSKDLIDSIHEESEFFKFLYPKVVNI